MDALLQRLWYGRKNPAWWLLPPSLMFGALVGLRRTLYQKGWKRRYQLPVPVLVVGNLTVGGTGKTPLTLALVALLRARGWRPGIVCRGYGAVARGLREVAFSDDPVRAGDEAVLMAERSGVPVWAGRDRSAAGMALLESYPEVDLLVSDDGLQHLALMRDMEIVVVDGVRGWGNGALLPAGPLREPRSRLETVDAVVIHGALRDFPEPFPVPAFSMRLQGTGWVHLNQPERTLPLGHFQGQTCHAVAGIGHPQRFFDDLAALGIIVIPHVFPDHHAYRLEDILFDSDLPVLMTEKDGIKCRRFGVPHGWMMPVSAVLDPGLGELVEKTLEGRRYGRTAA